MQEQTIYAQFKIIADKKNKQTEWYPDKTL